MIPSPPPVITVIPAPVARMDLRPLACRPAAQTHLNGVSYYTMSFEVGGEDLGATPAARLTALLQAALDLAAAEDLDAVLAQMVRHAATLADGTYAAMGIYREGQLQRFVHTGMTHDQVAAIDHPPVGLGLLGEAITAHGPTVAEVIGNDPRSVGFPKGHPHMSTFLGVPVASAINRHGNLYVTDKRNGKTFDEEDVRLVTALAGFSACAIDNALLVEAERGRKIEAERAAAAERRSDLRRDALERVIEAQESERARVARDLHDQIGQSLTSILFALRLVESAESGSTEAGERTAELRELVTDTLDQVRRVAFDLRPAVLDDIGLRTALLRLVSDLRARTGLEVDVTCIGIDDEHRLEPQTETMLYRIAQESLTNIVRHAGTDHARLSLVRTENEVRLQIADQGSGFDAEGSASSLGLTGMAERADLIGARFVIRSDPDGGTTVTVEVPLG